MACSCHGPDRRHTEVTGPMDQCPVCAKKHFDDAYGCYHEFMYTDANRDHIHRQLRACVNHTFRQWPDLAKKIRDLAQTILFANDADLNTEWDDLQRSINNIFYENNPEVRQRLKTLAAAGSPERNHQNEDLL